ncbi:MAG: AMP-binding protein [Bdellovibrionota bacterium]
MTTDIGQIVWQPSSQKIQKSFMTKFAQFVSDIESKDLLKWNDLHQWSVEHPGKFWRYCAKFVDIKWRKKPNSRPQEETSIDKKFSSLNDWLQEKTHWFEGAKLNFAENILPQPNDSQVLVSVKEGIGRTSLTAKELWNQVACCALSLQKAGVKKGDRVAGVLSNSYEAIIAMLATTSLGAIWSSCSPDFGVGGIVDRLAQISPKILFFSSSYHYNGKVFSCHQTLRECLPLLPSLEVVIQTDILYEKMTPTFHKDPKYPNLIAWQDFVNFTNCFGQNF